MLKDILIIEDDTSISRILELEFKYENYTFDTAKDGKDGLELFFENEYKIVLLDLMLPKINGLEVCRKIRRQSNTYIIMITAKRDVTDKVIGLDTGADDYITKPFEMEELLARIRAVNRRLVTNNNLPNIIKIGRLDVNLSKREVSIDGIFIDFTKTEYKLLEYLICNKGIVLTREKILNHVWGYDFNGEDNVLDVYIKYLRNKIDYPYDTKLIQTVRGVGYILKE